MKPEGTVEHVQKDYQGTPQTTGQEKSTTEERGQGWISFVLTQPPPFIPRRYGYTVCYHWARCLRMERSWSILASWLPVLNVSRKYCSEIRSGGHGVKVSILYPEVSPNDTMWKEGKTRR